MCLVRVVLYVAWKRLPTLDKSHLFGLNSSRIAGTKSMKGPAFEMPTGRLVENNNSGGVCTLVTITLRSSTRSAVPIPG